MNNILLGKTIKAMYKLSGKTIAQLSEETELTVDTINNLFYARIQKPGLAGVNALVKAMGFRLNTLMDFLEKNEALPESADVTEVFTQYITAADTAPVAATAKHTVRAADGDVPAQIGILNAEHEKHLDRFRAAYQRHAEQIQSEHDKHIARLCEYNKNTERYFSERAAAMKEAHEAEIRRMDAENTRLKRNTRILSLALFIETALILLVLVFDAVNRSVGWMR